jgi:hypothetical protein
MARRDPIAGQAPCVCRAHWPRHGSARVLFFSLPMAICPRAEVDYLKNCGATLIIMGEREIARGICEHILSGIGVTTAPKNTMGREYSRTEADG